MGKNDGPTSLAALHDFQKTMKPPDWLDPENDHLLGLSGGRDSVFLVHWLHQSGFQNITLCHLNHQFRGDEAERDAAFCKELAQALDLPFLADSVDVTALAKEQKLSLETAARQARHTFFARCAAQTKCPRILLAHHAEDQAETILFRLIRGSAGIRGMAAQKEIIVNDTPLHLLRPILGLRRSQIDTFLSGKQIYYREDESNNEPFAVRNRIRHEALPLLNDIFSRDPIPPLLRAEEHDRELRELMRSQLDQLNPLDPKGRLHLPTLRELPRAIQRQILHDYLRDHDIHELSWDLISRSIKLLETESPPALALPGGLRLRRRQSRIFISP
jgi:tRNA(Ile)-lysidine synthase